VNDFEKKESLVLCQHLLDLVVIGHAVTDERLIQKERSLVVVVVDVN
jgi:hypothetical protein